MSYDHWLPSKHGEDEAVAAMDVTEHMGLVEQYEYMQERMMALEGAWKEIEHEFERSIKSARLNWLNENRERLKQCLHDNDFRYVAEKIKDEARSLHLVPFNEL